MRKKRVGIFGGTFNPVHLGHVRAAAAVQKRFSLDRVLFIPSHIPPHKEMEEIVSPRDRMRMVELALRGRRHLVACPIEIRARGTSYSILTLNKVKKITPHARIFFILGVDAFLDIETWKEWERVLEQCLFIVMTRPGYRLGEAKGVLRRSFQDEMLEVPRSARIHERLFSTFRIFLVPIDALDISATDIRKRARRGESLKGWVPPSVEKYIREHKFYEKRRSKNKDAHGH